MAKIILWVENGCLFSSVTTLIDAFSIAELWHQAVVDKTSPPLFDTRIVSTTGSRVTARGGIKVTPDGAVTDIESADCIVISPIIPRLDPLPGEMDTLTRWVKALKGKGSTIATVCTGTFILAHMGILDGRRATTNWQYAGLFKKMFPKVILEHEYMITEDDGIICTGAATAVYHLAMHLIKTFGSRKLAAGCSKALLIDPNRSSQEPYMIATPVKNHGDREVLKAQHLMESNFARIGSVDHIAREVGISPRHFKRRFKKATGEMPLKYLQRIRIEVAKEKLETTRDTIDEITWAVGYQDISSFCRLFKQYTDLSPKAYRDTFFNPVLWA